MVCRLLCHAAGCVALNTHLLRTLISLTVQHTQAQQQQQWPGGEGLGSWLLLWLQLLSTSSLASAAEGGHGSSGPAAAMQRDLPVLLAALLPPGGRQQQQQQQGGCVLVGAERWLPVVVRAAAAARDTEELDGEAEEGAAESDGEH